MLVIGADPGLHGAICVYDHLRGILAIHDVPTIPKPLKGKGKKTVNNPALGKIFRGIDPHNAILVVERVGAMPGQGLTSTFNFGKSAGFFTGVAHLGDFQGYHEVMPAVWKRFHGLIGQDKNASRAKAAALFPAFAEHFKRAKDDGRAEAALIAEWGVATLLFRPRDLAAFDVVAS